MIKQASLYALEKAINKTLQLDPDIDDKLKPFDGKRVKIFIAPLMATMSFHFHDNKISISGDSIHEPDTTITSSPLGLIRLSLLPANQARSLFNDKIKIKGNVELGQQLKQLFDEFDIDWEGHIAHFTGDVIAHQIANFAHKTKHFAKQVKGSMKDNFTEYLQQETRQLPCREEIEDFMSDVDALRLDIDRLQAQIDNYPNETN